jgi:hypothetical protein
MDAFADLLMMGMNYGFMNNVYYGLNMIIIDPKFNGVDVKSITPAVQNAMNRECRFCDLKGASLKCNNVACDIYYHFYCFKKSKLRGL